MTLSGMIDRSIAQLQVQANGNANAGGAVVGTSGFTQNQANAAGLSAEYIQSVSDLIGLSTGAALTNAVNAIAPEPYAAFLSVGLDTLRQQRSNLLAQAGQCQSCQANQSDLNGNQSQEAAPVRLCPGRQHNRRGQWQPGVGFL
jgi:hypothetical protein